MGYDKKRVCVARIGAAHGVRGDVTLWSFTADPFAVARYDPLESADGERFTVEALRPGKGFLIARLKGVAGRDAAARLNNVELFVPRDRLPALDATDEFYHADLIGLAVMDRNGAELGRIVAVQNFGAGDLIEMAPLAGGETVLLPFSERVVPVIDIGAGRIVADLPDGLFQPGPDEPVQTPPLAGEGGETRAEQGASRARGPSATAPLTRSSQRDSTPTALSRNGRG